MVTVLYSFSAAEGSGGLVQIDQWSEAKALAVLFAAAETSFRDIECHFHGWKGS